MDAEPVDDAARPGPAAAPEGGRGDTSIQSIDRAAEILALFNQDTQHLSVAIVSERLGLNRTTAHRYLASLQSSGFLSKHRGPGPLLDQLSAFVFSRRDVLTLAPPIMRQLSDRTGLTVVLSLLGHSGPVVTLVEEAAVGNIVLTVRIGTVLEAKSSQARVLYAFQSDPAVVARHLSALDEADGIMERAELATARRDRLAWADASHLGHAAVAAPVFGARDIQAAMALLGTAQMLPSTERSAEAVSLLREAADKLSQLVGAPPSARS
ncbi:helix-turn-helix domain-containing protein [Dactylosporangium sp. NPDC005572]|uniref:IclR family transcriptional regulator n=1 Tax=Dactylosporangium sp. NPDC005572 TaxID=3156889 RepID=UPI0033BC7CE8